MVKKRNWTNDFLYQKKKQLRRIACYQNKGFGLEISSQLLIKLILKYYLKFNLAEY